MAHFFNGLRNVLGQTDAQLVAQIFDTLKEVVTKQIARPIKTAVSKLCPFGCVPHINHKDFRGATKSDFVLVF